MSLQQFYTHKARNEGLITPGFGRLIEETTEYRAVMGRLRERSARRDALLAGKSLPGNIRVDSKSPREAFFEASALALGVEWAEYLHARFGNYSKNLSDHMDGGLRFARSFVTQCHGKPGERFDSTVPMGSQGLSYILPDVYRIQHNDLPAWEGRFLEIDRRVDPASNEVIWYEMDNVGVARASSSYDTTTIPMVNGPIASDNKIPIVPALVGMETNFMDPRRERLAVSMGKPDFQIEVMKREACERTLAEFFDALWFGGDPTLGIEGLMNHPMVQTITVPGAPWSGKTALQILDDLKLIVWAIANRTAGALGDLGRVEIILPPNQYELLMQPQTSAGSASIMEYFIQFFKQAGRGVPKLEFEHRLAAVNSYAYNGGPNILAQDTGIVLYREGDPNKDPTFILSQPIEVPAPVRTTGVGDVTYYHARGGGMRLPDARRIMYITGM